MLICYETSHLFHNFFDYLQNYSCLKQLLDTTGVRDLGLLPYFIVWIFARVILFGKCEGCFLFKYLHSPFHSIDTFKSNYSVIDLT
jgi:hypothetical protein